MLQARDSGDSNDKNDEMLKKSILSVYKDAKVKIVGKAPAEMSGTEFTHVASHNGVIVVCFVNKNIACNMEA